MLTVNPKTQTPESTNLSEVVEESVPGSVQASMAPSIQPLLSVCLATFNQPHHRLAFTLPQVLPHLLDVLFGLKTPCENK